MATVELTRIISFSAAHRYYRPEWPAAQNREIFGPCVSEHGHNYECHVTVAGPLDGATGMVMNLRDLDCLLRDEIGDRLDHQSLNDAVPDFAPGREIPTSEALAVYVWRRLTARLPTGVTLRRVRIQEDATLFAEYDGGGEAAG